MTPDKTYATETAKAERLLPAITGPADLRKLPLTELPKLAAEIREEILRTVSRTGGHLASSLGSVELAIAAHYVFNTPHDIILWDVGHQAYAHKILTGRLKRFPSLRQLGGMSGFPNKDESPEYDVFTCGHSSTSISAALGLAVARDLKNEKHKIVSVIGDASLAGGMAFEAMNHAGQMNKDLIVILNDNELSISQSVGALSRYLNRIITNPAYNKIRKDVEKVLKRIPRFGFRAYRAARRLEEGLKNLLVPGMLFEELGFRYFGPIDGHNIAQLVSVFRNTKNLNEPILIHLVTKKGKGYKFAEANPADFHGTGPFDLDTGHKACKKEAKSFTDAFGETVVELAARDPRMVGITAAMVDGTGFNKFCQLFPERFFDVGIAEEHAVTFSAGLCRGGFKPVIAVYSTFLQRGYDQLIHDICLQKLPVVFCLDRAGIVGEDGPTHQGTFDIAYLRHMPNLTVMAPKDPEELKRMLEFAVRQPMPVAIRYPKGAAFRVSPEARSPAAAAPIQYGKAEVLREGRDVAILAAGSMVNIAMETALLLSRKNVSAMVVNSRFIKPLDEELLERVFAGAKKAVTVEEGVLEGGFGSAVLEFAERENIKGVKIRRIGLPDIFLEHGKRDEIFLKYNLTPDAICDVIMNEVIKS
ncbi:MAG: 1-deoxy-D-xylulose-5-phosphate synthase [Candidatus Omnitrophica bacterium]|nr:1-deoxy-D-xylulose-5-phosphate synthase [Candidatus Omnitrophota bacterium]